MGLAEELKRAVEAADVDGLLAEILCYAANTREAIEPMLSALADGHGASIESGSILLPSDLMEDFSDLSGMPRWDAEVTLGDGTTDARDRAYVPLERLVYVVSSAAVLYTQYRDASFDPWPFIAGMHANCNVGSQMARIPPSVREYLGEQHFVKQFG